MNTRLYPIPFAAVILLLLCCGKPSAGDAVVFRAEDMPKSDSLCTWLENHDSYHSPGYYATFEKHYARQLKKKRTTHTPPTP